MAGKYKLILSFLEVEHGKEVSIYTDTKAHDDASHPEDYMSVHVQFDLERYLLASYDEEQPSLLNYRLFRKCCLCDASLTIFLPFPLTLPDLRGNGSSRPPKVSPQ